MLPTSLSCYNISFHLKSRHDHLAPHNFSGPCLAISRNLTVRHASEQAICLCVDSIRLGGIPNFESPKNRTDSNTTKQVLLSGACRVTSCRVVCLSVSKLSIATLWTQLSQSSPLRFFLCVCVGGEGGRRRRRRRSLLLLLLILSHHEHPYGIHTNIGTGKPAKRVVAVSVSPWCLPLIVGQMSTPLGEANTRSRIVCARVLCRMLPTTITASPCSYSLDGLFVNHCLVHTPKHTYIHTHTHTCTHITIRVDGRSPCPP